MPNLNAKTSLENRALPKCASGPSAIAAGLRDLGKAWAKSAERPRIAPEIARKWDSGIRQWANSDLPLVIRKSGGIRGSSIMHTSGRELIVADNSPAQWAFTQAYANRAPGLQDFRDMLAADLIPFTFATRSAEKAQMKYRRLLGKDNINRFGWKLCHIKSVGLSTKVPLPQIPIDDLRKHFVLLMSVSNQFVVPLEWSGLGEVAEFISEVVSHDAV